MANLKLYNVFFAVVALRSVASQRLISPRLSDGTPIDTLRRFPHHVTIENEQNANARGEGTPLCGGSILNNQWILTSASCVYNSEILYLHFEKLYSNSSIDSYAVRVNTKDAAIVYPTEQDDIALIKVPLLLQFKETLRPVNISSAPLAQLENKLAVLPGYDVNALYDASLPPTSPKQQLTYAMLNIISNTKCKYELKYGDFDEYLQLCTEGYRNNPNTPCVTDYGSGLIVGWPGKPELVGIYSGTSYDCDSSTPAVYTYVAKYASWIEGIISR